MYCTGAGGWNGDDELVWFKINQSQHRILKILHFFVTKIILFSDIAALKLSALSGFNVLKAPGLFYTGQFDR